MGEGTAKQAQSVLICSAAVQTEEGHDLNLGDEAISASLEAGIRASTDREARVIRTINTRRSRRLAGPGRVGTSFPALTRGMRSADVAVLGGGTLFQADRGLALYCAKVAIASFLTRTPLVITAVGVEEVPAHLRPIYAIALRRAASVSVRDEGSAELLAAWGGQSVVSADPLFLRAVQASLTRPAERTTDCVVSLRPDAPSALIENLSGALRRCGVRAPVAVATDQRAGHDEVPLRQLFDAAGFEWRRLERGSTWEDCLRAIAGSQRCVVMRLHACIFAAVSGTPVTVLARDNKTRAVARDLGIRALDFDASEAALAQAITAASPVKSETLDALADRAQLAIDLVTALLQEQST